MYHAEFVCDQNLKVPMKLLPLIQAQCAFIPKPHSVDFPV
jgi:hypothetical protein